MRLTVEIGGKRTVVDVADDLATVQVGEHSYPVRVLARTPLRVELEIAGETVAVAGWPEHAPTPPGPVDVNGERWPATVAVDDPGAGRTPAPANPAAVSGPSAPPAGGGAAVPGGTPIVPPMPGRVDELRVRDGQAVRKGDVLLVLEAMKMRNEVAAPVDGVVAGVRVAEGTNVRARETMLVIAPPPA